MKSLRGKVLKYLKENTGEEFTAREIAKWIVKTYPDECQSKQDRSTFINDVKQLEDQLVSEIASARTVWEKGDHGINSTEDSPRKYYCAGSGVTVQSANNSSLSNRDGIKEHDLYPRLLQFLSSEFKMYGRRIDEKRSRNSRGRKGNKWLFPDVVGIEDLSQDWDREIKDCVKNYSDKKTKLWSFEVKILLNHSNVREAFFQAVSNSSWANLGYLVTERIEGSITLKELRILASLHGIGLIKLDAENPEESQIIISAKEKSEVDWDTANRLCEENKDFGDYIVRLRQFYQTDHFASSNGWSVPPSDD